MRERWFVVILLAACMPAPAEPGAEDVARQLEAADQVELGLESGDVASARGAYERDLQAHVTALAGARSYVDDYALLGADLDEDVVEALALAEAGTELPVQEKVASKTLEWYFFEASYAALAEGHGARARALAGLEEDPAASVGIGALAVKRDGDLGTTFHHELVAAYEAGDAEAVERAFTLVFAWSMRDELSDVAGDQMAGDAPSARASHAEADVYWDMIKDYAAARLEKGADVEMLEALIDVPDLPSPADCERMKTLLDGIFGL